MNVSVLTRLERPTVKINNKFKSVIGGPSDGFREIRKLALNERLSGTNFERPIAY